MHLDDLALFMAVAKTGGVTAAARQLGVPKSTISRGLGRLEEALDVTLVRRTTRRVALTAAGEWLRERTAPQLAAVQAALVELPQATQEPSGTLRVAAPVDLGATLLAEIVTTFTRRYPRIDVDVRISNVVVSLGAEGIDVALRVSARPLRSSSLVARRAGTIRVSLCASPQYVAQRGVPADLAALAQHDLIHYRGITDRALARHQARVNCDDLLFARAAAVTGAGIALLPVFLADEDLAAGRLVRILPDTPWRSGTLWLVHAGGSRAAPHVVAFRDCALDVLRRRGLG